MRKKIKRRYTQKLKKEFKEMSFLRIGGAKLCYISGVNSLASKKENRQAGKEFAKIFKGSVAGYKGYVNVCSVSIKY